MTITITAPLPDPATEPALMAKRVAGLLGVSKQAVYDAIGRGEIPSVRVGRSVRVPTALFLARYGLALGATAPTVD